ncbi:hypothetical protein [Streptomyces sp. NPDC051561]|uniref:hypothetical protein n=1 Tax=Streptomyces sp. NPDC051561 TaxID=3365658 RepID=UPI0037A084B1
MTAQRHPSPASQPLLPRPDRTTAALRSAVARLMPAKLPEMEHQTEEALSLAARTGTLAPLTSFLESWAVTVEIARIPAAAEQLRAAEYKVRAVRPDDPAWRTAMDEIGQLHATARDALATR